MNHKIAILYGIAIWAFVFIVAMILFPVRLSERPLFESIMPVALSIAVVAASIRYFKKCEKKTAMVGFCLGLVWLGISAAIDLFMFSWGPMKMALIDYIKDIGITYLMMPVITTGFGSLLETRK